MTTAPTTKPAAAKPAAPKAASAAKAAKAPKPEGEAAAEGAVAGIKLKDLVERVALAAEAKKPQVKKIVEAALKEIGDALDKGETLMLPGLGRLRVAKTRAQGDGSVLSVRLRRGAAKAKDAKNTEGQPLAEAGEDS